MATPKRNVSMTKQKADSTDQINFTLKVAVTDLPMNHKDFKIKLSMDFGSSPNSDLTKRTGGPNFNATRVRSVLNFISDR